MAEVLESHDKPELTLLRAKIWVWLFFPASCNLIVNNPLRSFVILSPSLRSRVNSAKDRITEKFGWIRIMPRLFQPFSQAFRGSLA